MSETTFFRFDPKDPGAEAEFEAELFREALERRRSGRDPELSAPERLEVRLRVLTDEIAVAVHENSAQERLGLRLQALTDEIEHEEDAEKLAGLQAERDGLLLELEAAVAAHEQTAETLTSLESERTAVRLELDRLLVAERGRAISEHRKRVAAEAEAKAAGQKKAAEARVQRLKVEEVAREHLRNWAKLVPDMVRLGWDAGDNWSHRRVIEDLRETLFRSIGDPIVTKRVFQSLDTWPTPSERS